MFVDEFGINKIVHHSLAFSNFGAAPALQRAAAAVSFCFAAAACEVPSALQLVPCANERVFEYVALL